MKQLNRNRAFVLLAVVEAIIVIPLFVLMGMGKISMMTSILTLFTVLFLTLAAVVYILFRFSATGPENDVAFDPDSVHVDRSLASTIMEGITAILVIVAWVIALASRHFISEDGGILYRKIIDMMMLSLTIFFIVLDVQRPSEYFLAGKLTNAKQVGVASLMYRVLALLGGVFLLFYSVPALQVNALVICWLAVALCAFIAFRILIRKAK